MKDNVLLNYNLQWFAKDGPGGEKTEPATSKKLKDAREDGKVAKSKELTAGVDLIVLFLVLKIFASYFYEGLLSGFSTFYRKIPDVVIESGNGMTIKMMADIANTALLLMLQVLTPVFIIALVVTILINLVQVKWKPTAKPMKPKMEKINPIGGFKKIISKDSIFELFKSLAKIALIVYVAYTSVVKEQDQLFILYEIPLNQAIALVCSIAVDIGLKISIVYLILGLTDFIYQKIKFKDEMKMTKQEVKDEFKNSEGNPEIKGRQRQKMRETSQRRMMQDVPKADVIITNPTHLSVALQYSAETAKAPVVVAKGEDYLALKIREIAKENDVEIIENKPLARMLYANVEIGAEVPPELYQAVAEVLAMVYNSKNK
ncbi:MAG: flagellar biosynthesis protein FlhB [Lachnospiraceae bacterium]